MWRRISLLFVFLFALCASVFSQEVIDTYYNPHRIDYLPPLSSPPIIWPIPLREIEPPDPSYIINIQNKITELTQAILQNPNNAELYYERGWLWDIDDYEKAIADFSAAIKIKPDHVGARNERAEIYNTLGEYDRAIADCTELIRQKPNVASYFSLRGEAYYNKCDYEHALIDYHTVLHLSPNFIFSRENYSFIDKMREATGIGVILPFPGKLDYTVYSNGVVITGYAGNAGTLNIPGQIQGLPVISISESAFAQCSSLTQVVIPSSVTSIGRGAFSGCSNLTEIFIPSSVTSIGMHAFSGCTKLEYIKIPPSVTNIREGAFNGCSNLVVIALPSTLSSIEQGAFFGCDSLKSVTLPAETRVIRERSFHSTTQIVFINGVIFDRKTYRIQVGSYSSQREALDVSERLRRAGFSILYERDISSGYHPVEVANIRAELISSAYLRLRELGYMELTVKRDIPGNYPPVREYRLSF